MDLENELRQAMVEHVTAVAAPATLAHDARRRHQRTVRRRTAVAMTAAGLVVAVAVIPTYQSFRPQSVGSKGAEGRHKGHQPALAPTSPSPLGDSPSTPPAAGKLGSHTPKKPSHHSTDSQVPGLKTVKGLLGYLPAGIDPTKSCQTQKQGPRETTACRWTGSAGWIELRIVHDHGLSVPGDLGLAPAITHHSSVHGHPALRGDGPTINSQLMWIEHGGLGVWVGVSPNLSGHLTRIADGVHVT